MTSKECKCLSLILALFILYFLYYSINSSEPFINYNVNGIKSYLVLERRSEHDKAANILHTIDNDILKLISHFNEKYSYIHKYDNTPKNQLLLTIKNRLKNTYKSESLKENFPDVIGKDVSYNINKGEDISLCLRNYDNPNEFHDINDIKFVALHELAHSCNESYGHDTKFWKIFRIILENAVEIDIFKNHNYKHGNVNYCSMNITYNPIFDKALNDENYFK